MNKPKQKPVVVDQPGEQFPDMIPFSDNSIIDESPNKDDGEQE